MVLKWCQPDKHLYISVLFVLYKLNFVRKRTLLVKCPWGEGDGRWEMSMGGRWEMGDGRWSLVFSL